MKVIVLDSRDNVATAAEDLATGSAVSVADHTFDVRNDIPRGHKIALAAMQRGQDVIRYGEIIGSATADVAIGEHVHTHNLISKRIPGRDA